MNENLATIQRITSIKPHTNSDNLELATVLGWQVVVKKGEVKVGDLIVYIVIDTVLPPRSEFEFLKSKNYRIKSIRLRGEPSNGIIFPCNILPEFQSMSSNNVVGSNYSYEEGSDVTNLLGVTHYESPIPVHLAGMAAGSFPGGIIMTDELNLRSYPSAIDELVSMPYYLTLKMDGSSATFFRINNTFGVCSRRINLKETSDNGFWKIARKYNIENAISAEFPNRNMAVQGELYGPGIQKNRMSATELELAVFNIFDTEKRFYLPLAAIESFSQKYNIPMVPVIEKGNIFGDTLSELITKANNLKYKNGAPAEGLVVRPQESFYSKILQKSWSGKVINENYTL